MGAIVLSYKLEGIDKLRLNAALISGIFRGEIERWDDARLAAVNPGLHLPAKPITPVYRSDGSGTTAVFSDYLSKADSIWRKDIGSGKSLKFPAGIAAKGNPGVAGILAETEGAIGYIGSEYALALQLPSAILQNRAGHFVEAGEHNIAAAADNTDFPSDTRATLTDSPAPEAYPIATFTWLVAYTEQQYNKRSRAQAEALSGLFLFLLSEEGQKMAGRTFYTPLPPNVQKIAATQVKTMTYGQQLLRQ
jgi:phosphate transport system substrate-binding protein